MNIYSYSVNQAKSPEIQDCFFVDDTLEIRDANGKITHFALDKLDTLANTLILHYGAQEASELYSQSISERSCSLKPVAIFANIALWIVAIPALPFLYLACVFSHDSPQSRGTTTGPDYILQGVVVALGESFKGFFPQVAYEQSNEVLLSDLRVGAKNLALLNRALAHNEQSKPIALNPLFTAHMHSVTSQIACS